MRLLSAVTAFQEQSDICKYSHPNVIVGFYIFIGGKRRIVHWQALLSQAVSSCPTLKDNYLSGRKSTAPLWTLLFMSEPNVVTSSICPLAVKWDLNDPSKHYKLNVLENASTAFVFIIVVVNVFITAFGVQRPIPTS